MRRILVESRLAETLTRRDWLRVGALGAAGLTLPDLFLRKALARSARTPGPAFGRAKSCILLFLFGAPAHQDIWDLKPDAPSEYRGEFNPIASHVPGIQLGEHIPRLARVAHRYAIIRSVSHPDNTHTVAMHYMLTGVRHAQPATNPRNQPSDYPTFGAVMNYLRRLGGPSRSEGPTIGALPAGISLNAPANQVSANNHIFPGFFAGLLGNAYDPMFVPQDPSAPVFEPLATMARDQALPRQDLRTRLENGSPLTARPAPVRDFEHYYQRAFELVTSPAAHRAFNLAQESRATRERYGMNPFGQATLLSRRLVEAGVPLVTINWERDDAYWDTHADNFNLLKNKLLPPFDLGFSALLEDLHQRGLLDETLVVCLGEFGRTPTINRAAGRDHWAACNSVVLAGAGIRGGVVHGASDRIAAYPTTPPISPDDLAATIYHALGVDLDTEIRDLQGRPLRLTSGRPLLELHD